MSKAFSFTLTAIYLTSSSLSSSSSNSQNSLINFLFPYKCRILQIFLYSVSTLSDFWKSNVFNENFNKILDSFRSILYKNSNGTLTTLESLRGLSRFFRSSENSFAVGQKFHKIFLTFLEFWETSWNYKKLSFIYKNVKEVHRASLTFATIKSWWYFTKTYIEICLVLRNFSSITWEIVFKIGLSSWKC